MILYYALVLPSAVERMVGLVLGIVMICSVSRFKVRVNTELLFVIAFAASYFLLDSYIGYSTLRGIAYGGSIVLLYLFGLNWGVRNYDDYEASITRALMLIHYALSVYIIGCVFYTFLSGRPINAFARNPYVFWNGEIGNSTHYSSMSTVPLAISMFLMAFEKGRTKRVNSILFILIIICNVIMANRIIFLFVPTLALVVIFLRNKDQGFSQKGKTVIGILILLISVYLIYSLNIFDLQNAVMQLPVFQRSAVLRLRGYEDPRLERQLFILQHFFENTNGGGYFTNAKGDAHNVWLNIYDYAGIIPFALFLIFTIAVIIRIFKLFKYTKESAITTMMIVSLIGFLISFFEEPVMRSCECYFVLFFFVCAMSWQLYQKLKSKGR